MADLLGAGDLRPAAVISSWSYTLNHKLENCDGPKPRGSKCAFLFLTAYLGIILLLHWAKTGVFLIERPTYKEKEQCVFVIIEANRSQMPHL